ncbi:MAG: hypothetical protein UV60_C0006G0002 [Parcubacteria group bacterium GW2011_GWA2_43_11]|nr:MAG: hypothetical protein UV60_C0006G0002 [Parcubacteria group bacterium GW2011_GWA2_43_11]
MSEKIIEKGLDIAANRFHTVHGLIASLALTYIVISILWNLLPVNILTTRDYVFLTVISLILDSICWAFHVWYYPKRSKKQIGVVVAIRVDCVDDQKLLKQDFIKPLHSRIDQLKAPFDLLVLKNHQSEKIDTIEDVRDVLKKTNAHFCIWGAVKRRVNTTVGEKYYFILKGAVKHKPIQEVQQVKLREELNALLPNQLEFEKNLQFDNFKFRADQVAIALDYVTGRAALLSGDYMMAIKLHEPLYNAINNSEIPISKKNLKNLLSVEYDTKATIELLKEKPGVEYGVSVKKALEYNPNNISSLLKRAILEFDDGCGDARKAQETIKLVESLSGEQYQWLYSKTFLHLWLKEYKDALKCCEQLKLLKCDNDELTAKDVWLFNIRILKKTQTVQVYYWLGFITYFKLNNPVQADEYFQRFIENSDDSMVALVNSAKYYIEEIKEITWGNERNELEK